MQLAYVRILAFLNFHDRPTHTTSLTCGGLTRVTVTRQPQGVLGSRERHTLNHDLIYVPQLALVHNTVRTRRARLTTMIAPRKNTPRTPDPRRPVAVRVPVPTRGQGLRKCARESTCALRVRCVVV